MVTVKLAESLMSSLGIFALGSGDEELGVGPTMPVTLEELLLKELPAVHHFGFT